MNHGRDLPPGGSTETASMRRKIATPIAIVLVIVKKFTWGARTETPNIALTVSPKAIH
jgi:hypothetical protein